VPIFGPLCSNLVKDYLLIYVICCMRCRVWCRKDVRLPVQLQRAMAAEAEATREAKAKVILIFIIIMIN